MSALLPLQIAVVARLEGDTPLMARITGVHDGMAPEDAQLDYLVIGEPTEVPFGALGTDGYQDTLTLHLWSGYVHSRKEVLEIAELVDNALAAPLAINGHTSARLKPEFRTALLDTERGRRWHAPIRYRVTTFEVA